MSRSNRLYRCGTEIKSKFYSIPESQARFNYFAGNKLKNNPTLELNGRLANRSATKSEDPRERKQFRNIPLIKQPDSNFFEKIKTESSLIRSQTSPKLDFSRTRIGLIANGQPAELQKQKSSSTFKSSINSIFSFKESPDKRSRSLLKRTEFTKYTNFSQILLLPGKLKRNNDEIKDDINLKPQTTCIKKGNRWVSDSSSKVPQKTNLKNLSSISFGNCYKCLLSNNVAKDSRNVGMAGFSKVNAPEKERTNKKNRTNQLTKSLNIFAATEASDCDKLEIGKAQSKAGANPKTQNLFIPNIKKKANKKQVELFSGIKKLNLMHIEKDQPAKNNVDTIYNALQEMSHKKSNCIMTNKIFYKSKAI